MNRPFNLKAFVISTLRRASYRYPPREEARRKVKVGRNQYRCEQCNKIFSRKETKIDHVEPVVPVTGWISFDSFIERLFCDADGFQVLCKEDHDKKTKEEGLLRKAQRAIDKKLK